MTALDTELDAALRSVATYMRMFRELGLPVVVDVWADALAERVEQIVRSAA